MLCRRSALSQVLGPTRGAVRAIRTGVLSARELTERTYNRIKQYNPKINAVVTLIEDQAMARARQADEALAAGNVWGALHGLPILIKDQFSTRHIR
jgi:amidase